MIISIDIDLEKTWERVWCRHSDDDPILFAVREAIEKVPVDWSAPCNFGYERHDLHPCVTHRSVCDSDSYSEAQRDEHYGGKGPICYGLYKHTSGTVVQ
jgi:hypothetical protein